MFVTGRARLVAGREAPRLKFEKHTGDWTKYLSKNIIDNKWTNKGIH